MRTCSPLKLRRDCTINLISLRLCCEDRPTMATSAIKPQQQRMQATTGSPRTAKNTLLTFELKAHTTDWVLKLVARIIAVGLITAAISFGANHLVFSFKAGKLFGREIDIDLQLALLGLLNKIMDLLVTISLEDLAGVALTMSLVGRPSLLGKSNGGVGIKDLELSQELTKPWAAISSFYKRCTDSGWSLASVLRFVLGLTVSICLLLQGVAINTIGMPKERWYTQTTQPFPFVELDGIDMTYWSAGYSVVGGGPSSWDAAAIYSAAAAYSRLVDLPTAFGRNERGWQLVGTQESDPKMTALNTAVESEGPIRGVAVNAGLAQAIFNWIQSNGTAPAKDAIGWNASLDLIGPAIATSCTASNATTVNSSVQVDGDNNPPRTMTITVGVEPNASSQSTAAECTLTLGRCLFPVTGWIIDSAPASVSVNRYGREYNASSKPLPHSSIDDMIARDLRIQLSVVFDIFEDLVSNLNTAQILRRNAQRIQQLRPDITRENDALAAVITTIGTTLLAGGAWNTTFTPDPKHILYATGIKWQVYGSGPRLGWQWTVVIVLAVLLITLLAAIAQSLVHRVSPADVLKPAGMLVAANQSKPLEVLAAGNLSGADAVIGAARFCIACDGRRVEISDKVGTSRKAIDKGTYMWGQS
ncbi:hypothetical protein F503_06890 [Ophiostoma piceae UAMH 11346]|uniref:Uncharacterized protein n=1 Tax=Ophiostoma piceae (strain UAMH 11346) TaxID=1262450 RepID=S3C6F0_OPHP1|nr:hypothetical protein F503_06890 [Ophiostoma piceae UAMH 11346]